MGIDCFKIKRLGDNGLTNAFALRNSCYHWSMITAPDNHIVYILLCANSTFYIGYTTNLERRYAEHQAGSTKCKYTRSFKPIAIAQSWKIHGDKALAMKIERYLKRLKRNAKQELIGSPEKLTAIFPCELFENSSITNKKID
jgi:putative endonuclease